MQISLVQRIYIHLVKKTGDLESMIERSWRNFFLSSNPNWLWIILFLGIFPKFVMKSKSITSSLERFLDRFLERFLRSLRIVEMLRFPSFLPSGRESVFRLCNPRGLQRVGRGQIGSVHLRYQHKANMPREGDNALLERQIVPGDTSRATHMLYLT